MGKIRVNNLAHYYGFHYSKSLSLICLPDSLHNYGKFLACFSSYNCYRPDKIFSNDYLIILLHEYIKSTLDGRNAFTFPGIIDDLWRSVLAALFSVALLRFQRLVDLSIN